MNANKKRVIAVICLLVFIVGIFVACKKNEDETLVSVSTDENGSLYYTDPTREADGLTYGGETHFVKPDETNKNGEYKIGDVTSAPYTTDRDGNLAPVTTEPSTTAPADNTTTTSGGNNGGNNGSNNGGNNGGNGGSSGTSTTAGGNNDTSTTSGGSSGQPTQTTEEPSYAGIDDVVDDNNLNNDGVIEAW